MGVIGLKRYAINLRSDKGGRARTGFVARIGHDQAACRRSESQGDAVQRIAGTGKRGDVLATSVFSISATPIIRAAPLPRKKISNGC